MNQKPFEVINTKITSVPVIDAIKSANDYLAYHHIEKFGLMLIYAVYTTTCDHCSHVSQYAVLIGKI